MEKIRKAAATIQTDKNALSFCQSLSTFICKEYCLDAEIDTSSTTLKSSNYHSLLNKFLAHYLFIYLLLYSTSAEGL